MRVGVNLCAVIVVPRIFFIDMAFFHIGLMGAGEGGEGVVEERYVTLGGYTVQRYEALQGGGGCQVFRKKALRNT